MSSRWAWVVPGLLLVALVFLVIGLATSTSWWLAVSLALSVVAAVLLVVERLVQRRRDGSADAAADGDEPAATEVVDLDAPSIDPDDPEAVWVVDGRPRYHTRDCATIVTLEPEPISRAQALEDGFVACSLCEPGVRPASTSPDEKAGAGS